MLFLIDWFYKLLLYYSHLFLLWFTVKLIEVFFSHDCTLCLFAYVCAYVCVWGCMYAIWKCTCTFIHAYIFYLSGMFLSTYLQTVLFSNRADNLHMYLNLNVYFNISIFFSISSCSVFSSAADLTSISAPKQPTVHLSKRLLKGNH